MVNFCFEKNSKLKKSSISKIHGASSNTNLTSCSLYYELSHIRYPDIFIIRGIFRTLAYSKVRRYLHPCQIFCSVFWKYFYNLGQKVGNKFTKLNKLALFYECFTADICNFFNKKRQNLAFGWTVGYPLSNPSISEIFLKFPNFLRS